MTYTTPVIRDLGSLTGLTLATSFTNYGDYASYNNGQPSNVGMMNPPMMMMMA